MRMCAYESVKQCNESGVELGKVVKMYFWNRKERTEFSRNLGIGLGVQFFKKIGTW